MTEGLDLGKYLGVKGPEKKAQRVTVSDVQRFVKLCVEQIKADFSFINHHKP